MSASIPRDEWLALAANGRFPPLLPSALPLRSTSGLSLSRHDLQPRLQHLAHGIHPGPQRLVDQVGVALGSADLGVTQQPTDHFQRGPARNQQGGEGVAQIVDTDIGDFSLHAHPFPKPLEINHGLARNIAGEKKRAAFGHGIAAQADQGDGLMRDGHAVHAALLGVGGLFGPDGQIKVELVEGRGAGLAAAGAGQHAQADDPSGTLIGIGAERVGEALDFVEREEALAGGFGALAEAKQVGSGWPTDFGCDSVFRLFRGGSTWLENLL